MNKILLSFFTLTLSLLVKSPLDFTNFGNVDIAVDNVVATSMFSIEYFQINPVKFKISPNPSTKHLNISILYKPHSEYTLEVYDVLGKQVYRGQLNKNDTTINVTNWRRGVYLVKFSSDQSTETKRFVKQ